MNTQHNGINAVAVISTDRQSNLSSNSVMIKDIEKWLVSYLAELMDLEPATVDVLTPFPNYGLDSAASVVMVGDLENWLKRKLPESLLFSYPTIKELSVYLAD
jgi:acyl carrier protein